MKKQSFTHSRKPKFGMRKLSIGLASCMLGMMFLTTSHVSGEVVEVWPNGQNPHSGTIGVDPQQQNLGTALGRRKAEERIKETLWVDGVKIDEKDFEHMSSSHEDYFAAEYGKGSGYYDVNKKMDSGDSALCVASVVTNMFHWWVDQNRDNIEKFKKQDIENNGVMKFNGVRQTTVDELNHFYKEYNSNKYADQSKFFDLIKSHFGNRALNPEELFELYFNGFYYNSSQRYIEDNKPAQNNLFSKVLENNKLLNPERSYGIDGFSNNVINALKSHKVLGLVHTTPLRYRHIISMWGADIDQDGKVKAIYVTDSDDREITFNDNSKRRIGMKRYDVLVDDFGNIRFTGKGATHKEEGAIYAGLYSLSRGDEVWEDYFKKYPEVQENLENNVADSNKNSEDVEVSSVEFDFLNFKYPKNEDQVSTEDMRLTLKDTNVFNQPQVKISFEEQNGNDWKEKDSGTFEEGKKYRLKIDVNKLALKIYGHLSKNKLNVIVNGKAVNIQNVVKKDSIETSFTIYSDSIDLEKINYWTDSFNNWS